MGSVPAGYLDLHLQPLPDMVLGEHRAWGRKSAAAPSLSADRVLGFTGVSSDL